MKTHEDLEVWKLAITLASDIYTVTRDFPNDEKFGLISQMRRAAVSIASNIAEGAARQTKKEFIQFLCIASGSASELSTQLIISRKIGLCSAEVLSGVDEKVNRISRMLQGLIRSVKS